jgi:peptidoglycan hydrolase CwlO-like protein
MSEVMEVIFEAPKQLVPVKLSSKEIQAKGQLLAEQVIALAELRDEKAASNSEFNRRIKELQEQVDKLSQAVNSGVELREAPGLPFE